MSEDLKPCPFCGYEPTHQKYGDVHWVQCPNCGASMRGYKLGDNCPLLLWDKRTIEDALRAELAGANARIKELETAERGDEE